MLWCQHAAAQPLCSGYSLLVQVLAPVFSLTSLTGLGCNSLPILSSIIPCAGCARAQASAPPAMDVSKSWWERKHQQKGFIQRARARTGLSVPHLAKAVPKTFIVESCRKHADMNHEEPSAFTCSSISYSDPWMVPTEGWRGAVQPWGFGLIKTWWGTCKITKLFIVYPTVRSYRRKSVQVKWETKSAPRLQVKL